MRLPLVHLEHTASGSRVGAGPPLVDLALEEDGTGPGQALSDLVAPAAISVDPDHLLLDGEFARVLALVGLPPAADPGWLESLVAATLPADVALFITPADVGATAGRLASRQTRLQPSLAHDAAEGRLADPNLLAADEQIGHLRHALARGAEQPFTAALYVLLHACSRAELDRRTRQAQDAVAALGSRLVVARLQQEAGLHACVPEGTDALGLAHPLETSSLVTAYPFPPAGLNPPTACRSASTAAPGLRSHWMCSTIASVATPTWSSSVLAAWASRTP